LTKKIITTLISITAFYICGCDNKDVLLKGQLTDRVGNSLDSVEILAYSSPSSETWTLFTDQDGNFELLPNSLGQHEIPTALQVNDKRYFTKMYDKKSGKGYCDGYPLVGKNKLNIQIIANPIAVVGITLSVDSTLHNSSFLKAAFYGSDSLNHCWKEYCVSEQIGNPLVEAVYYCRQESNEQLLLEVIYESKTQPGKNDTFTKVMILSPYDTVYVRVGS